METNEKRTNEKEFKGCPTMRKLLKEFIERKKITKEFNHLKSKQNYSNTNWAYDQADSMGYMRAYSEVISLLED